MIEWLRRPSATTTASRSDPPPADTGVEVAGRTLPIELRRHARARRLTMRLAPDGAAVRITLPHWARATDAIAFARLRAAWLAGELARLPPPCPVIAGGTLPYRGRALAIAWHAGAARAPALAGATLSCGGPEPTLPQRLRRWLEGEAVRLLAQDLAFYAPRAGVAPPPLKLSRATRRWGSCADSGVVRINWRLVMAPDAVRRSVVAHEVAHLVHFDHSPRFHAFLRTLFDGDLAAADAWLKAHGRTLYTPFG